MEKIFNYYFNSLEEIKFSFDLSKIEHSSLYNSLLQNNTYEPEVTYFIFRCLKQGDCFMDIGASQGFFSLFASKIVGTEGLVIAIEPGEDNLFYLNRNIKINNIKNCKVYNKPITDKIETIDFYINLDNSCHTIWDLKEWKDNIKSIENPKIEKVATSTIDQISFEINKKINIIKIDTEGAEGLILKGANRTLLENKNILIISEIHEFGLKKLGFDQFKIRNYMKDLGYDTFILSSAFGGKPKMVLPEVEIKSNKIMNVLFANKNKLNEIYKK